MEYIIIFFSLLKVAIATVFILYITSLVYSSFLGAPYVPIKTKSIHSLLSFAGARDEDIFFDLGCGDGRVLRIARQDFHVAKAVGYELSWWPYLIARWKNRKGHTQERANIYRKNFLNADISPATFIFLYLFPDIVDKVAYVIGRQCKPGTRVFCVSFPIDLSKHKDFVIQKTGRIDSVPVYLFVLNKV